MLVFSVFGWLFNDPFMRFLWVTGAVVIGLFYLGAARKRRKPGRYLTTVLQGTLVNIGVSHRFSWTRQSLEAGLVLPDHLQLVKRAINLYQITSSTGDIIATLNWDKTSRRWDDRNTLLNVWERAAASGEI